MLFQPPLPPKYSALTDEEMGQAILERKRVLGSRLVILGHHYQQDEVIRFADFTGDSLKLSQIGAQQKEAEFIVFCGVRFMAESADILTDDRVKVILPDLSAGCSMADMADLEQVEDAWEFLTDDCGVNVIPITYVNSAATIKAFCGCHGGACCTSSNARMVLEWAFRQGDRVMFLPDQHLGRNTAYSMGIPLDRMVVYDPKLPRGGLTPQKVRDAGAGGRRDLEGAVPQRRVPCGLVERQQRLVKADDVEVLEESLGVESRRALEPVTQVEAGPGECLCYQRGAGSMHPGDEQRLARGQGPPLWRRRGRGLLRDFSPRLRSKAVPPAVDPALEGSLDEGQIGPQVRLSLQRGPDHEVVLIPRAVRDDRRAPNLVSAQEGKNFVQCLEWRHDEALVGQLQEVLDERPVLLPDLVTRHPVLDEGVEGCS